jgi:hypothetical protein
MKRYCINTNVCDEGTLLKRSTSPVVSFSDNSVSCQLVLPNLLGPLHEANLKPRVMMEVKLGFRNVVFLYKKVTLEKSKMRVAVSVMVLTRLRLIRDF